MRSFWRTRANQSEWFCSPTYGWIKEFEDKGTEHADRDRTGRSLHIAGRRRRFRSVALDLRTHGGLMPIQHAHNLMKKVPAALAAVLLLSMLSPEQAVTRSTALAQPAPPIVVTDKVSPDAIYGSDPGDPADPSGKAITIVTDPSRVGTLYVATFMAGVWKSTDGARTWQQASAGMKTGISARQGHNVVLAIDEKNPLRLLLATQDDDLRNPPTWGGLYVTVDGAATWTHAFSSCPNPQAGNVAFSGGRAFAPTHCGLATSTDLVGWTFFTDRFGGAGATNARIAVSRSHVYACQGSNVWQSASLDPLTTWSGAVSLGKASCVGVAALWRKQTRHWSRLSSATTWISSPSTSAARQRQACASCATRVNLRMRSAARCQGSL
jgi:hypothetical protein